MKEKEFLGPLFFVGIVDVNGYDFVITGEMKETGEMGTKHIIRHPKWIVNPSPVVPSVNLQRAVLDIGESAPRRQLTTMATTMRVGMSLMARHYYLPNQLPMNLNPHHHRCLALPAVTVQVMVMEA
jgi:hypothetical protein